MKGKDEKQGSSLSLRDVKEGAESGKGRDEKQKVQEEAAIADEAEPVQEQVDSVSLETYREKLYIEVSLTKACIVVLVFIFSCKAHQGSGGEVSILLNSENWQTYVPCAAAR